jgi:hypothetical protein
VCHIFGRKQTNDPRKEASVANHGLNSSVLRK